MTEKKATEVNVGRFERLGNEQPPEEAKGDWTYIVFVLDRSGSMGIQQKTAVDGFNKFVADQQKEESYAQFTLVLFNTEYEIVYNGTPIKGVEPLTTATYVPNGGTALHDAVGRAINETKRVIAAMPKENQPTKIMFVILTDGEENASQQYNLSQIRMMIKAQQECGWPFLYLAATDAGFKAGAAMNIAQDTSFAYKDSTLGTQSAFRAMSFVGSSLRRSKGLTSQAVVQNTSNLVRSMLDVDDEVDLDAAKVEAPAVMKIEPPVVKWSKKGK